MIGSQTSSWEEVPPVQSLGSLKVHLEGEWIPSEEVDPNDLPGGDSSNWPFIVAPYPSIPVVPNTLYFRDGELICILGRLVWFESNGNHIIIQDPHDSRGPRDLEGMHRAVVNLRDDRGSAHQMLFCMQNVMEDRRVEQVEESNTVKDMSACLSSLECQFEMFILDEWAVRNVTPFTHFSLFSFLSCSLTHILLS